MVFLRQNIFSKNPTI
uniref:Trimethoprim-resistant dihydrofolate reductase n=1 Tax=Escherichia coli TaxID=562 RepID=A0A8E8R9P2_ECOLX|nr:trimethoprim-resistant dihydrofolate reductase [Escherichia coli]